MSIGEFASLKRFVTAKENQAEVEQHESHRQDSSGMPSLGTHSKLFELDQCATGRIFLVYQVRPELATEPAIWLYREDDNGTGNWYHLADSFTKYFRMMLVHLGLPLWQYCAASAKLPTWVEQVYYLVGPHLLPHTIKPWASLSASLWKDGPPNTIDPAIFKGRENKQRNSRKKSWKRAIKSAKFRKNKIALLEWKMKS